jgi:hypothetical protein
MSEEVPRESWPPAPTVFRKKSSKNPYTRQGNARATGGPGILPETCGITSTDPTINRPLLPNPGFYQQQTFAAG